MDVGDLLLYVVCYFGLFTSIYTLLTLYENRRNITNPKFSKIYSVSVIVPAFNEEKTIKKTIESLLGLDYPKNKLQIIVIDDGSTDNTFKIASSISDKRIEIYRKENGGKGAALNYGLKKARGEIVGALDADSFVDKHALKRMIGYFGNKKVVAVTPSLRVYKPKSILQRIQMTEYIMGIYLRKIFSFLGSIHVTPGPFTMYRKEFFDKYGGYDEDNMTEDIEVALRLQDNGFEIENSVDANVYTVSPYHFRPLLNQRLRWYLGFIENVYDYRHLFNPKHGNLGLMVLPAAFISVFFVILTLFYTLYISFRELFKTLFNYYNINFDLSKIFEFKIDFFYINLESYAILAFITLIFGILIIILAKSMSKETERLRYHYVLYTLVYWFLFGFWWLGAIILKITGRRIYWGGKKL